MTELTQPPGRLLTIADYAALSEDDRNRWELQEGNLVMLPSPTPPASLIACHLGGEFGYQDVGAVSGVFETEEPFHLRVDLPALI